MAAAPVTATPAAAALADATLISLATQPKTPAASQEIEDKDNNSLMLSQYQANIHQCNEMRLDLVVNIPSTGGVRFRRCRIIVQLGNLPFLLLNLRRAVLGSSNKTAMAAASSASQWL